MFSAGEAESLGDSSLKFFSFFYLFMFTIVNMGKAAMYRKENKNYPGCYPEIVGEYCVKKSMTGILFFSP